MKSLNEADDLVPMGRVLGPYGIEGFVKIESYADSHDFFQPGNSVFLEPKGGVPRRLNIVSAIPRGRFLLVRFEGFEEVGRADRLSGSSLLVPRSSLGDAGEDQFYWFELIGLKVLDAEGAFRGEVKSLFRTEAHDVLVVRSTAGERLIPAVEEFVREVDLPNGTIRLEFPEEF